MVVVGNKNDLKPDHRQISTEEGQRLAEEFKCSFTEASARMNTNVTSAFEKMVAEIEKSSTPSEQHSGNKCLLM